MRKTEYESIKKNIISQIDDSKMIKFFKRIIDVEGDEKSDKR